MKLIDATNVQGGSTPQKVKPLNSSISDDPDDVFSPAPNIAVKLTREQKAQVKAGLLRPGRKFRKFWLTPLDRAIVNYKLASARSQLGWKRRDETNTKTHKRNRQWHRKQEKNPWHEAKPFSKSNDPRNCYPLFVDYVFYLQGITDRFYLRRLNASQLIGKDRDQFERCFPNKSTRIQWHGRIVHSWSSLKADQRNKLFRGDYDLDITKCHLTIFLSLVKRFAPGVEEAKSLTVQGIVDCLAAKGFPEKCVKNMLNAAVHGAGEKQFTKIKKKFEKEALETPEVYFKIKEWRDTLFRDYWVETPFGEIVGFRNPDEEGTYIFNKRRWERCLGIWENYLKIRLFHNLTQSRCHIVYDSYDGCIIKVNDRRMIGLIREEIQSRCDQIGKELGVTIDYKMKEIM